jgi:hypothetical protein
MTSRLAKILLSRFVAAALGALLFCSFSWMPLRVALCAAATAFVRASRLPGVQCVYHGSPTLQIADMRFDFTAMCTFLHYILILLPFIWRLGDRAPRNLLRSLGFVVLASALNFARVCAAVYFHAMGVRWSLCHDLPVHVICNAALIVVALSAIHRDGMFFQARSAVGSSGPAEHRGEKQGE